MIQARPTIYNGIQMRSRAWLTARWGYRLFGSSQVQRLTIQAARDPYPWHADWWKGSDS